MVRHRAVKYDKLSLLVTTSRNILWSSNDQQRYSLPLTNVHGNMLYSAKLRPHGFQQTHWRRSSLGRWAKNTFLAGATIYVQVFLRSPKHYRFTQSFNPAQYMTAGIVLDRLTLHVPGLSLKSLIRSAFRDGAQGHHRKLGGVSLRSGGLSLSLGCCRYARPCRLRLGRGMRLWSRQALPSA